MLAETESVALVGTEAHLVEVEVDIGTGIPKLSIVGLPAKSVTEADQRVRSALASMGQKWPQQRIVANLAPGGLRKEGTHFDLPIALGILAALGRIAPDATRGWVVLGELALDGSLRPVRGVLAAAIRARAEGRRGLICPAVNASEAVLAGDLQVVPASTLKECVAFFQGKWVPPQVEPAPPSEPAPGPDMSEVRGHPNAKRALEIAAAGGHNVMLIGPPGSGKTMLAQRLPGILPAMSLDEALEVTQVYSVAGLLQGQARLVTDRPFRSPHQHVSLAGLIGGGSGLPRPGEVSLAHHGVLFLDEITLFRREVLETLRGPIEEGLVRIARSAGVVSYPCRFSLLAAMNPCPCGYEGDEKRECSCSDMQLRNYANSISGPLLDRFDIQVQMCRLTKQELLGAPEGESSTTVRARVEQARDRQAERYGSRLVTNACAVKASLDAGVDLSGAARALLGEAIDTLCLTGRGLVRVLRLSRTIADLAGDPEVTEGHIAEALLLRLSRTGTEVAA